MKSSKIQDCFDLLTANGVGISENFKEFLKKAGFFDLPASTKFHGPPGDHGGNSGGSTPKKRIADYLARFADPELFNEMFRVARNLIIFGGNYFGHLLPPSNCVPAWPEGRSWKQSGSRFSPPYGFPDRNLPGF